MSKEFEQWMEQFEKTPEYLADSFHWADMARDAFTAGRALGRREVKGDIEAFAVRERVWRLEDECGGPEIMESVDMLKAEMDAAIEAIPEEV